MSATRWTRKQPTAAEKRANAHQQALENCKKGYHTLTPTFRPGEHVCLTCQVVFYCPHCLKDHHLEVSRATHAYPVACRKHQKAQVQA